MLKSLRSITLITLAVLISGVATAQVQMIENGNGSSVSLESHRDGQWIQWDNGVNDGGAIGTGQAVVFSVASRWTPEDLSDYDGLQITDISFVPMVSEATYTLKIWTGTDLQPQEVYSQPVSEITIEQWNEVVLETPFTINAEEGLWFGYEVDTPTGHPAGCDSGPQVDGKGNMMFLEGSWYELIELSENLTFNWSLAAFVTGGSTLVEISSEMNFSVYPNPAKDIVNISAKEMIQEVSLADMAGRVVYSVNVQDNNHQINLGDYNNGIYLLQVVTNEGVSTKKLQISK